MIQERVALVLRVRKEDLCWRLLGREAPKGGGWSECEWVERRLYPALAIHFAAPNAALHSADRDVTQGGEAMPADLFLVGPAIARVIHTLNDLHVFSE